jgi:nucleoside-diphosphate-sugar epimerase
MPKYLVTGGLGFIGSHVTTALLRDPQADVTVVDFRLNPVFPLGELVDQIKADCPGGLHVRIEPVAEYRPDRRFDVIYHLASVVGPAGVLKYEGHITESIARDTYAMVRLAQEHSARLLNVSTSEVYGGGDHGYCTEDIPCVVRGPSSARQEYAVAKLACEVSLRNLCRTGKLDAVIVRPFNIAGVRQLGTGGFVVPRFVGQAILRLPLTVFGDGSQVRAFTDARDVAAGILVAAERGERGSIYNVGNAANRITIRALAETVLHITDSLSKIDLVDPKTLYGVRYEEAADKFPEAGRLASLGWRPCYSLVDTVRAVFESMRTMPEELLRRVAGLSAS